ncbi:beta-klotho [Chanos chanos]|uniref:Beta-klotho n=1 Tax=Chanos chanos TaxID=29144 RepID=A0A6J2ULR3_CHACN|nr:beta-klotho [Chanos chanos]
MTCVFSSCAISLSFFVGWCMCGVVERVSGEGKQQWLQQQNHSQFFQVEFPAGFLWGVGSSAFQTEGSWNIDGKGPSIWDHFTHSSVAGGIISETADISSNSYALWETDIKLVSYLGVQFHAFSLSWPRLFPDGFPTGHPNRAAVEHYQRLIRGLRLRGVEPVVTLFHWDFPQALQDQYGGWRNSSIVEVFADYAAFCFATFGTEVKIWLTMHNPFLLALQGYGTGVHAPGETGDPKTPFTVAHNLIKAHAKAWHVYNSRFRPQQKGRVSITLGSHWVEPFKGKATPANVDLCQRSMEAVIGWFAEPIYGSGDYPASLKASNQGLVPEFTAEERLWVRGTADFFSLAFGPDTLRVGQGLPRFGQTVSLDLRRVLGWIRLEYKDPEVLVAESGWFSDASVKLEDTVAIYLMKRFISQVLQAITLDSVKVFGYTAWSLVDGFEWNYGYSVRRGLFHVDFSKPDRPRVPKTTAKFYRQIISNNGFPIDETVENIKGHFPCDFQFGVADSVLQVHFRPFSPQFSDPHVYRWNFSGDGALRRVAGVSLHTRGPQCSDFLAIRRHIHILEITGSSHYRFALDWALLLPHGDLPSVNSEALRYYRCILKELQRKGVHVAITLYHPSRKSPTLGLPKLLHAQGGWMNRSTVKAFQSYANLCYQELGKWVSLWITINEPNRLAESYNGSVEDRQRVTENLLQAHARAWHIYDTDSRHQTGGMVSFALHADWVEPANPFAESHAEAAHRFLSFELGRFLDPLIGKAGEHPADGVGDGQGSGETQIFALPHPSEKGTVELKGALDFIALNHFTTRLVSPLRDSPSNSAHGCSFLSDPTWPSSSMGQSLVPWGLRRVLRWVRDRYGDAHHIIVTATGVDDQASYDDQLRQSYIRSYLQEALKAQMLDGIDLRGLYVWRLQDRHAPQFGLFSSSHFQSQPKRSVNVYREIITRRGFPAADATVTPCQLVVNHTSCPLCAKLAENKPLLFFGVCVFISVSMLTVVIPLTVMRKRRRRRRRKVPVHNVQPRLRRQQKFAMQQVPERICGPRL